MTGGYAVVLGLVGRNFAAGMSGGLAYVLDRECMFHGRCNTDMVDIEPVSADADQVWLHDILHDFVAKTGSTLAQSLLDDWPQSLQLFHKVIALTYILTAFVAQVNSAPLWPANTNLLSAPRVRTTFASRGFSVAAPAVWNSLPSGIHDSSSTHTFRRLLKTHCFQQAFGSP